jgi:hypothetical protein
MNNHNPEPLTLPEKIAMWLTLAALAIVLIAMGVTVASAATKKVNVAIHIYTPLAVVVTPAAPTVPCGSPPGTVVASISYQYGDGNAVGAPTIAESGSDFAISGANVVVGPNGIAVANCGMTENVTITVNQP